MTIEINRRDFLQIVFASASAAAASGAVAMWPIEALARPIAEPADLKIDENGYLVDANMDYCDYVLPTRIEYFGFEDLPLPVMKSRLVNDQSWQDLFLDDPEYWTDAKLGEWLKDSIEYDDLGPWQGMKYTPHGPALDLYNSLGGALSSELGLQLDECSSMCSDFVGVQYFGDVDELNRNLARHGFNLVISAEA